MRYWSFHSEFKSPVFIFCCTHLHFFPFLFKVHVVLFILTRALARRFAFAAAFAPFTPVIARLSPFRAAFFRVSLVLRPFLLFEVFACFFGVERPNPIVHSGDKKNSRPTEAAGDKFSTTPTLRLSSHASLAHTNSFACVALHKLNAEYKGRPTRYFTTMLRPQPIYFCASRVSPSFIFRSRTTRLLSAPRPTTTPLRSVFECSNASLHTFGRPRDSLLYFQSRKPYYPLSPYAGQAV